MAIMVDKIRISGFRGIKSLEVNFSKMTVIFGSNNAGKTSVIKAIQLALGDYSRYLSEEDFFISLTEVRAREIIVDIRIIAIDDDNNRTNFFDDEWTAEFGDKIQSELNGNQFVALRTRTKPNPIKAGFETHRFTLEKWPDISNWLTERVKESPVLNRMGSIGLISIEAQRDIHQDLKERSSFICKVLADVEYNEDDISALEELIREVNDEALNKSSHLQSLKTHLENLNQSFQGFGNAEITPFPKKIRDLSKYFSVHFGENHSNSFSMEYHGMGTRSWASMLTVRAFTDLITKKHQDEFEPFFPILATEEPEAHLHPNAQKTIYQQLANSKGQVIVSTHSPYIIAMANQSELVYLNKPEGTTIAQRLPTNLDDEEKRRLQREVMHSRGEILFSKALVLCEGETEEQALPLLFSKYFEKEPFELGVSFIGVGGSGSRFLPFLRLAQSFYIPIFIFSDGEQLVTEKLKKAYESVFGATNVLDSPNIVVLDNQDFESYLLTSGFKSIIEQAIKDVDGDNAINEWILRRDGTLRKRVKSPDSPCSTCGQHSYDEILRDYRLDEGYNRAILDILDSGKTKYAPAIAKRLCELPKESLPEKVLELFEKVKSGASV